MIILKPSWITHSDRSSESRSIKPCIYSLHAHPDGKRLATGGLDTTVRIWNTEPILDEAAEADPNCHRLLCTMTRHNGAVLCVRWSNNDGRYLASSSDNDNVVIIWELDNDTSMMTSFGSAETNYENWRPVNYLRGHDSDVQDLSWSKDNQYLASCGVDGSVIIWDGVSFDKVTKIDQHSGFVKGITWDPVGKFLASQSDDKVLKIWRTSDWKVEQEIKGPFINAPSTTLFRRMSWSPNGSHIVTANAVNGVHCIAAIVNRDEWTADVSLVGHQLPIEVASFNPKLFYMSDDSDDTSKDPTKSPSTICALGGQDRSVSIWVTRFSEPLCVAADIFDNSIYDISWSPDGQTLYACSQDGSVACLRLEEELSDVVPDSEVEYQLSKYGSKNKALLPEAPVQLELEDRNAVAKKEAASKRIANLMGEDRPATMTDGQQTAVNGLTGETSSVQLSSLQTVPENPAAASNPPPSTPADVALEQKVTIGKDGKKRITPVVIRSNAPALSMASSSFAQPTMETAPRSSAMEYDLPENIPAAGIAAAVVGTKRKPGSKTETVEEKVTRKRPIWIDSGVVPPSISHSRVKLGIPKVRATLLRKSEGDDIVMECRNPTSEHGSAATKEGLQNEFARISATKRGQELWNDYLPSTVLHMTGDARHFVVSCEDGSIHVYSNAGRRLLPPLVLDSTPTVLRCENGSLLCITSTGLAYTWDLVNRKCCLSEVSIAPILQIASVNSEELKAAPSIKDVRIHKNGIPLIVTNYRQAFAYDMDMKVWLRVSDARYILSEFWTSSSVASTTNPLGWLSNAMSRSQGLDPAGKSMMALINADRKASSILTISYLEMQMAVAVLLDSPTEYQECLLQYARRLASENCQQKVQELCRWLAGPPFVNDVATPWEPTILGTLSKRDLLKQILPLLGSNRQLQRIVAEYSTFEP